MLVEGGHDRCVVKYDTRYRYYLPEESRKAFFCLNRGSSLDKPTVISTGGREGERERESACERVDERLVEIERGRERGMRIGGIQVQVQAGEGGGGGVKDAENRI
jgi:hypothetical protein